MTLISRRPQPLGIHPLPTGYLLLPPVRAETLAEKVADEAYPALMRGERPAHLPPEWEFYGKALDGDVQGAVALLRSDASPIARYNTFVMAGGTPHDHRRLKAELPAELHAFVDAAAFTMGIVDQVPSPGEADGELRAHIRLVEASSHLEHGQVQDALNTLEDAASAAAPSPLFQAQVLYAQADARREANGVDAQVVALYQRAIRLLEGSPLTALLGGCWLNLGTALQETGRLREAILAYQEAVRFISRESDPEAFALAQNNLGLAYLAAPMSDVNDQLRSAVAVSALREALTVYTRKAYPMQWASTQLNLANALQYLPSAHPADNLAEAVRLYEDLYTVRTYKADPLGYARLRANQGTALAHLGIFDHARTNLIEAQAIFREQGESDAAESIDATLQQIADATTKK